MAELDFGDGKVRPLQFTIKAIEHFEKYYGKSLFRVRLVNPNDPEEFQPEIAISHRCITHALWAALITADSDITYDGTQDLMQMYVANGGDITGLGTAIGEAIDESGLFGRRPDGVDKPEKGDALPN
jgi:hypothetical protein